MEPKVTTHFDEATNTVTLRIYFCLAAASLIPEGMAEADDGLRGSRHELLAGNERGLADRNENLLTGFVFPTIAHGERESLADIVELHLIDELHVGGEADDEVGRYGMDVQ